jgi:imidazolonepropionase-like amidohydrolase
LSRQRINDRWSDAVLLDGCTQALGYRVSAHALDLAALQHVDQFAVLDERDRRRGGGVWCKVLAGASRRLDVTTGKDGGEMIRPWTMAERQCNSRTRFAGRTSTDRVHDDHRGATALNDIVHGRGRVELFESHLGELLAHRREKVLRISLTDHAVMIAHGALPFRLRASLCRMLRTCGQRVGAVARVLLLTFVVGAMPAVTFAQDLAFVGGRIIDGAGKVIDRGTIVIRDGKIAQVGDASLRLPAGVKQVDMSGATILPGLVNAHGHLTGANGMRNDPAGYTRDNLVRQLTTYARYGVTTVFSLGDDQDAAFRLRDEQTGVLERARLFVAGPVIYGVTAAEARAMTDKVASMKPDLLKIRIDDNLGSARKMPDEAWRATIARAEELKLPVATHIFYLADAKAALMAGADVIAHSVRDVPVDAEFIGELKARGACYTPTLMREVSTFVYGSTPPWARDPFFLKGAGEAAAEELSNPTRQAQVQSSGAYKQGLRYKEALEIAKRNLKTLSEAGVRIAMGTDTGPAGRWQGFFEHLELEMMVESGLTPMQAIVAATGEAARCHGKAGQFGTIEPGASADLVILNANPLDDIRNTRLIRSIWITGRQMQ